MSPARCPTCGAALIRLTILERNLLKHYSCWCANSACELFGVRVDNAFRTPSTLGPNTVNQQPCDWREPAD